MNSILLKYKWFAVLCAVLTVLGFVALAFHHHTDDHHANDCPLCRLVECVGAILLFAAAIFLLPRLLSRNFPIPSDETFESSLLEFQLKDRAPPFIPAF